MNGAATACCAAHRQFHLVQLCHALLSRCVCIVPSLGHSLQRGLLYPDRWTQEVGVQSRSLLSRFPAQPSPCCAGGARSGARAAVRTQALFGRASHSPPPCTACADPLQTPAEAAQGQRPARQQADRPAPRPYLGGRRQASGGSGTSQQQSAVDQHVGVGTQPGPEAAHAMEPPRGAQGESGCHLECWGWQQAIERGQELGHCLPCPFFCIFYFFWLVVRQRGAKVCSKQWAGAGSVPAWLLCTCGGGATRAPDLSDTLPCPPDLQHLA